MILIVILIITICNIINTRNINNNSSKHNITTSNNSRNSNNNDNNTYSYIHVLYIIHHNIISHYRNPYQPTKKGRCCGFWNPAQLISGGFCLQEEIKELTPEEKAEISEKKRDMIRTAPLEKQWMVMVSSQNNDFFFRQFVR